MEMKVYHSLNEELVREWQDLWERSSLAHSFNSPWWHEACVKAFGERKMLVVAAYSEGELVGVLPVVWTRKYGIGTYTSAGRQYLDKSTLLVADKEEGLVKGLLKELAKMGNFYLNEMSEEFARVGLKASGRYKVIKSSTGRYLVVEPDPYRYLRSTHKRKYRKIIEQEKGKIRYEMVWGGVERCLETMMEIEFDSPKKEQGKEVFSDSAHRRLCRELNRLSGGEVLISLLYYENKPVCYRYGLVGKKIYHDWNTAYRSAYRWLTPGGVLTYLMMSDLEREAIKIIDFSRGDSRFKRELTPDRYEQYALLYSANAMVRWWWWGWGRARGCLEKYPRMFEIIRRGKKRVEGIVGKSVKNNEE